MTLQTPFERSFVPVLIAPMIDPGAGRIDSEMPFGSTVAEIVRASLPGASEAELSRVRVMLVSAKGAAVVLAGVWHRVRPFVGTRVVIRLVPAGKFLRSVLTIIVAIAAIAAGQIWGAGLAASGFGTGLGLSVAGAQGLIGLGVTFIGNMLINALVPPPKSPEAEKSKNTYTISQFRNDFRPDGVVPDVMGKHRYAPPFAAMSYSEIVGDQQYIRALFCFGYGPLTISDIRIGDTPLSKYKDVQSEVREGLPTDLPVSLYPRQVIEDAEGPNLTRPLPRDAEGEIIEDEPGEETPVVRFVASDSKWAAIVLSFPAGLFKVNDEGEYRDCTVTVRIRQRAAGSTGAYSLVKTLDITASVKEGFYRQHQWELPARGGYEIETTLMSDEETSTKVSARVVLAAVQSIRPEYPINFDRPLALLALRIKATHQLSGALDRVNAMLEKRCLDWNRTTSTWIERETRNPASKFRHALQSAANAFPVPNAGIDLEQLAEWHEFCRVKGLKYDRVHDFEASLLDQLAAIASAGRATPRHDGVKWGVVIDRPQTLVIDHINPRNSEQFTAICDYVDPPHGFRVKFLDATNNYQEGERIVPWPDHEGPITLTEDFEVPGKTDPVEVFRECRRRQLEIIHRPNAYTVLQDGAARVATRGDLVVAAVPFIERSNVAARVKAVEGRFIELDAEVEMEAGHQYAVRFRVYANEEDSIGISYIREIDTLVGVTDVVKLKIGNRFPTVGEIVHFGKMASESLPLIVKGVEAGKNMSSFFHLLDAAPQIDQILDATPVPAWTSRVGFELDTDLTQPKAPRFRTIRTGISGTGNDGEIILTLGPGVGSAAVVKSYELDHRKIGVAQFQTILGISPAEAGATLKMYSKGDQVILRARALSEYGVPSPNTQLTITVGAKDANAAPPLDSASISAVGDLGHARLAFNTGSDTVTKQVRVWRAKTAILNRTTDVTVGVIDVGPGKPYSLVDGDNTRPNLIDDGSFDTPDAHAIGPSWSVTGGLARHVAGNVSAIEQDLAVIDGRVYRTSFRVRSATSGSVTMRVDGGTAPVGGAARTAIGTYTDRLVSTNGTNKAQLLASADFVGTVDDWVVYPETGACLPQGVTYYFFEPLNAQSKPGPLSGPFAATII
ncbi:hypothetical protein C8J31_10279 [Rhizobium sp. PP-CC-2G-626]|nr:hypothetical protein C8J31_10279 [Rhizobium sp. PP-CC-2G-626]